ncbi:sn-1-specific diacylglycerol lipase [Entamoeba marina]
MSQPTVQIEIPDFDSSSPEFDTLLPNDNSPKPKKVDSPMFAPLKKWLKKTFNEKSLNFISSETQSALYQIIEIGKVHFSDFCPIDTTISILYLIALSLDLNDSTFLDTVSNGIPITPAYEVKLNVDELTLIYQATLFSIGIYGLVGKNFKSLITDIEMTDELNLNLLLNHTKTAKEEVVSYNMSGNTYDPGYLLCVKPKHQMIVLVFRGSLSLQDCMTDLVADAEPVNIFKEGTAHSGIFHSGTRKFISLRTSLETLQKMYPNYLIMTCGHSLGGGVATVVAALMKVAHPDWNIKCVAVEPACVFSQEIACCEEMKDLVVSIVNNNDLVPRLSLGSFENFKSMTSVLKNSLNFNKKKELLMKFSTVKDTPIEVARKHMAPYKDEILNMINTIQTDHSPCIPSGRVYQIKSAEVVEKIKLNPLIYEVPNQCYTRIIPKISMWYDHFPAVAEKNIFDCIDSYIPGIVDIPKPLFKKPQSE